MSLETKHREISRQLLGEIASGKYGPDGRLPSEAQLVKRFQVLQPPVLPGPDFAEISSEFHKPGIYLRFLALLPGQDLIDLGEHELSSPAIELGQHRRISSNEARQANQGFLLLAAG